jgi:hypothetical protein
MPSQGLLFRLTSDDELLASLRNSGVEPVYDPLQSSRIDQSANERLVILLWNFLGGRGK